MMGRTFIKIVLVTLTSMALFSCTKSDTVFDVFVSKDLKCNECFENPIGFAYGKYFRTKKECEKKAMKNKIFQEAQERALDYCQKKVLCVDEDCKVISYELSATQNERCRCHINPSNNRWVYSCHVGNFGFCCCRPEL